MMEQHKIVAAIILAAGTSSRMGDINKLLVPINGTPMIRGVVEQVSLSQVDIIIVVTGYQSKCIENALKGFKVSFSHNKNYRDGLSASLFQGLNALPALASGALVCLGDMPKVSAIHINFLVSEFYKYECKKICIPTYKGHQGNPVLWPRSYFVEMKKLSGDSGAKNLINQNIDKVIRVPMNNDSVIKDIDTLEQLNN